MKQASSSVKGFVVMAAIIIVLSGIKIASTMVIPFLLSVFIALACNPIIDWTSRFRVPRWLSVIFVILLILTFGFMLAGLVSNSMSEFSQKVPQYRQQLAGQFSWVVDQLARFNIQLDQEQFLSMFDPAIAMNMATNVLSSLGGVLTNFLLILLTVVFMLFEAPSMPKKVHIALDDPSMKIQQIDKFIVSIKNYLAIKSGVSLATGAVIGVWLWFLGVDHFLLWGVLAFLLNFIPNIGSIIAAVPAVLLALVQLGPTTAGLTALGYVVSNTVMGNVVEPKFMGKGLGLSTLVVFLSLVFWGWLLGTVGMLLSVPLTMIVKIALESSEDTRWFALMLASDEEIDEIYEVNSSNEESEES